MRGRATPGFDRRTFIRGAAFGLGAFAVSVTTGCSLFPSRGPITTVGEVDFSNILHVPPLAESTQDGATRVFAMSIQAGTSSIVPAGDSETWGVNGPLLGPTVRARRGETVRMEVDNELDEATTLHWHGMRLPAAADGGPHQMIEPGDSWTPSWTIDQHAATLWYHPHPHGETERHVYMGIAGLFIIDDDEEAALDLPRDYGVDDIPLIVQDRTFDDAGALIETDRIDVGMLGDTVLVNGTFAPVFDATATHTRFRILNASSARTYNFGFDDDRAFAMIGSDGGLLSTPFETERIMLSPGERAEIVVTMEPDTTATLRSFPQDLGVTDRIGDRTGANDELDILLVRAAPTLTPALAIPAVLGSTAGLDEADAAEERTFELGDNRINGQAMDMHRIDAEVAADTVEVWTVANTHTRPHNFHIHDVQFLVLDVDGEAPPAELAGWKDTIYIAPGSTARLIMQFGDNSDPDIPYMFHCHLLWHEDQGMMGQFVVV